MLRMKDDGALVLRQQKLRFAVFSQICPLTQGWREVTSKTIDGNRDLDMKDTGERARR